MAGTGPEKTAGQRGSRATRVLAATLCAALLALSAVAVPAALAGPANEYHLQVPKGSVGDSGGGSGTTVVLIAAAVVIAGTGALVYVKRRGNGKEAT